MSELFSSGLEAAGGVASKLATDGGTVGFIGAGVTVGVQALLKAGNDCGCGK